MNEARLLAECMSAAARHGLLVHHQVTACPACRRPLPPHLLGTPGFPDLLIAGPGGIAFRELKTRVGILSPAQKHWRRVLAGGAVFSLADFPIADVWREPDDLISGRIENECQLLAV